MYGTVHGLTQCSNRGIHTNGIQTERKARMAEKVQSEIHLDNRGLNWIQVRSEIRHVSNTLHIGYDTLYAYLFQAALATVQKRIVAGCNTVIIVAQFGDYDNPNSVLQSGRLVMQWIIVYTDLNTGMSPVTVCTHSRTGKDSNVATNIYDSMVATLESEVEV